MLNNSLFKNNWDAYALIAFLLFMGLFYQIAWQYPVVDSFPLIERLLDPNYLTNDFYTNSFDSFSPRLILASCIAWVSEALGIHYTYIVAYGNIVRIFVYGLGLFLFYRQLANKDIAIIAFALSSLSFLSVPFLPAWWPVTFDFTASNLALVFSIFTWFFVLQKRVASALVLLTVATLFHPLVGVQNTIIAIILFICHHKFTSFYALFTQPKIYLAGIVYSIVFLSMYLSFDKALPDIRFVEINGYFRHGHHFLLSHMDIEKWISTALMLTISLILCFKIDLPKNVKIIAISFFAYSVLLTLIGYVFIEVIPTRFMVSFIPMRAFPIIVPLMVLIWACYTHQVFQQKNYIGFLALLSPFLPYKQVGLTWFLFPEMHELILPIITIILAFSYAQLSSQHPVLTLGLNTKIHSLISWLQLNPKPTIFLLPIGLMALSIAVFKFNINIPKIEKEPEIYSWLIHNTSTQDVVLAELNGANNQKIRLLSKRSVVISKDFPFNENYYEQWYKRYSDIYITRELARGRIDALNPEELNEKMDKYQINVLVRTQPINDDTYFNLIGESMGETARVFIYRNKHLETLEI